MAKGDTGSKSKSGKACCLVSELLEDMGLDAHKAREIRRQALLGLMTYCQWQLARIDEAERATAPAGPRKARGRRVRVV